MKTPVVPVPALGTEQLKKGWEEKHLSDPAALQSLPVGLQIRLQAVPLGSLPSAIAAGRAPPATLPPVA